MSIGIGLSRQLQQTGTHMSTKSYGTITHMPPELLLNGHLSTKVGCGSLL